MWGIIPAAGSGSRIQPLAFSKELLPVGSRMQDNRERPRAVSEYLIDRMEVAGVTKICMVISSAKSDIIRYYGPGSPEVRFCYCVQQQPSGLCDAIFQALPFINDYEHVIVGLPDTIWFPENGLRALPDNVLSFLLFPVAHPEFYDAVETDREGTVGKIKVKEMEITTNWVWGAFKIPGSVLRELFTIWKRRECRDEYFGTLVNAYLSEGGSAKGIPEGDSYVDVGTLNGYREALKLLQDRAGKHLPMEVR